MNTATAQELIQKHARKFCGEFHVDDDNRQAVLTLSSWLAREPRQGMDLNKGLLMIGNVGTGKTMLIRALRSAMVDLWGVQFGIKSAAEMVRLFTEEGYDGIGPWIDAPHVCFDDLGTEGEGIHFGKRTNIMAEIIEARYDRMMQGRKAWTHFTTNLGTDALAKHVGPRAASRLRHICNIVDLGSSQASQDRRQTAPAIVPDAVPVSADNVYSIIHPSIATRLLAAMRPLVDGKTAVTVERKEPVTTRENDLEDFADKCASATDDELTTARAHILKRNLPGESAPWIEVIDAELKERETKQVA